MAAVTTTLYTLVVKSMDAIVTLIAMQMMTAAMTLKRLVAMQLAQPSLLVHLLV